jgi:hypothetical protein
MEFPPRKIPLFFYRTSAGAEPVREWLRELDAEDRNAIGQDLMRVQYRWPVGKKRPNRPRRTQLRWRTSA